MTKRKLDEIDSYEAAKMNILQDIDDADDTLTIKNVADSDGINSGQACGWYWNIIRNFEQRLADEYLDKGASLGDNYCLSKKLVSHEHLIKACGENHPYALYDMGMLYYHKEDTNVASYFLSVASELGHKGATELLQYKKPNTYLCI